ncbi:MAG: hypothetical protein RIQ60_3527 [Pseudomonadota bacterium]|jgi:DNA-binding response OmpR family regulator
MQAATSALKKILIVDDVEAVRRLVRLVSRHHYEVLEASDAEQALALLRSERPALMILDINLPGGMNGLELLEQVRADPELHATRVIVASGRGLPSDPYIAAALHIDAYFVKPFSPLALADRVDALLGT